ncbi:MAG: phosphodiesterase [Velocimicrobium sp.]
MKYMVASDIHGSFYYCNKMLEAYEREEANRLILLGDILYHGPRNDLPKEYNPKKVIECLNAKSKELLCVRGNCEAEVDQMVLEFPIMAEYAMLVWDNLTLFATHGHIHNKGNMPPLKCGDILLHGHTHVQAMEAIGDCWYLNPGSVSIPKEGNENSYMIYEDHTFCIKNLDGTKLQQIIITGK